MSEEEKREIRSNSVDDQDESSENVENLVGLLNAGWYHRKRILRNVLIVLVLSIVAALVWPMTYTAETTILPDLDFLNSIGNLGGFKDLASAAGLNLNMSVTSPSQLYPDIIQSEVLLKKIIYHKFKSTKFDTLVNLVQYFGYDDVNENLNFEKSLQKIRESIMDISVDKKSLIITLAISTPEPQLSADIANAIVGELDNFQRNYRRSNAFEQRKFLESRLAQVNHDLDSSETSLKIFREKNRVVEQSPELMLQQERLARQVELNSSLFIQLTGQYESAKLDEIKNTPVVQVLDAARLPAKKSKPKRSIIVIVSVFLSLAVSISWYLFLRDQISYFKKKLFENRTSFSPGSA